MTEATPATNKLFTLSVCTTGQPGTRVNPRALPDYTKFTYRQRGFVVVTDDIDGMVAAVRQLAPTAKVRRTRSKGRVSVWCPADLTAELATLDTTWQAMAIKCTPHREMQNVMINEPTYRQSAYRAW